MNDESKENEVESTATMRPVTSRLRILTAIVVVAALIAGAVAVWKMNSSAGKDVPAPKSVTFGDDSNSGPAPSEVTITIEPEQVERIGIKTATVSESMSSEVAGKTATGVIEPNQYRSTPAISLVGGVVRRVDVELGQKVEKGRVIAMVFSDEFAAAQAKHLQLTTDAATAAQNLARAERIVRINQSGNDDRDEAQAKLKTAQAVLDEQRKRHARTVKLVEIGASSREELEQATTLLRSAEADLTAARSRFERAQKIANINPQYLSELEAAELRLQTARSELTGSRQRLQLFGMTNARIDALRSPSQISSEFAIVAPVSGTVTARSKNAGEVVESNSEIARVTDLSTVWAITQVFDNEIASVATGSGANITSDAIGNRIMRGQVTYVDPNVNPETRTAQVRVEVQNPGEVLKLGMYVRVALGGLGKAEKTAAVVPTAAVQNLRGSNFVFVTTDKPNVFIMKPVRLGPERNGEFEVIEGIKVGEKLVTDGSFLLRAEAAKTMN